MYRADGKKRRLTPGKFPQLTLAKAREKVQAAFESVDVGGDPAREKADRRTQGVDAVEGVIALFIERYAKVKTRRWKETEALFEHHVVPVWGKRDIGAIRM